MELRCWLKPVDVKVDKQRNRVKKVNKNKLVKSETFVYAVGVEDADLKNESLFQIFAAFRARKGRRWPCVKQDVVEG